MAKIAFKFYYLFFFVFFVFSVGNFFIGCSKTPTSSNEKEQIIITGSISENTVWESGKEYVVKGVVTVEEDASLTINGNVTILFKGDEQGSKGKLMVNGALQALGTDSSSLILFKPYDVSEQDNAYGIELDQSRECGVFEFCRFEGLMYGVNAYEASVFVSDCEFIECVNGIMITKCDSALIQGSEFVDNEYGVRTDLAPVVEDTVRVIGNVFMGASECGVEVNNYSKAVVKNNLFSNCEIGLMNANSSVCRVVYNDFERCDLCCFCLGGYTKIEMNNFNSGDVGVSVYKKSGKRISAMIPVHIFGNAVNFEKLIDECKKRNIKIIEDATESLGTKYIKGKFSGKHTGTIGELGCLSFNGNKIITSGGGGMILMDNKEYAKKAKYLTTQAKDDEVHYIHNEVGYNYRMTNIQAALGVAQLEQLPEYLKIKKKNFQIYKNEIDKIAGLYFAKTPDYADNNHWMYPLQIKKEIYGQDRKQLMAHLSDNKIQTRPVWYLNHLQKPYKDCQSYKIEKAIELIEKTLCVPCSVSLSKENIETIIRELNNG